MGKKKTLCCRVTEKQYSNLTKLAEKTGNTSSECIRKILDAYFKKSIPALENREDYIQRKELRNEINRIGTNINQIAHNTNMGIYTEFEKRKLFALMNQINTLFKEIL